ncbi:MAG: family 20 glycosylhydrolase [Rickettsiaceae bacterium]
MIIKVFSSIILLVCIALFVFYKKNEHPITIDSITIDKVRGDNDKSSFSFMVNLNTGSINIPEWKLGFYIVGASLHKDPDINFNPNLEMKICDNKDFCGDLEYVVSKDIKSPDLSHGYTTILKPKSNYPLVQNNKYTIKILHINQWGGWTVSYFPQNFFIIIQSSDGSKEEVKSLYTDFNMYTVPQYDHNITRQKINKRNFDNWNTSSSESYEPKHLSIVPLPVSLNFTSSNKTYINLGKLEINYSLDINDKFKDWVSNEIEVINSILPETRSYKKTLIEVNKVINEFELNNNPEGYKIEIKDDSINIEVIHEAGIYYAIETLKQIVFQYHDSLSIPTLKIIDYPKFKYRGIFLDLARHYFTLEEIKSFIHIMGAHKLNTLHLHFSDDEAFRLDIPFYPALKNLGSKRGYGLKMGPSMLSQKNLYRKQEKSEWTKPFEVYGYSYTTEDIREIIRYANLHQITVIPEIDIPGHSRAIIKALPEIFIDDDNSKYISAQGYTDNTIPVCQYNAKTEIGKYYTNVINEIIAYIATLFNNQDTLYTLAGEVSIGGDEVSETAWKVSDTCNSIFDLRELTSLEKSHKFFKDISRANNQIIISGWQQFVQSNGIKLGNYATAPNRVGHVWVWSSSDLGTKQATNLIKNQYPTVISFSDKLYFDITYTPEITEPGLSWSASYSDTYSALSVLKELNKFLYKLSTAEKKYLLGLEGAVWSENIPDYDQLIYMTIPKMAGLSEASWSVNEGTANQDQKIHWKSLARRLGCGKNGFLYYLSYMYGLKYRGYPGGIQLEVPSGVVGVCN